MATTSTLPVLDPETVIGRGGFGTIYAHPEDSDKCIKVLSKPLNEAASLHLQRLIDVVRWARPSDVDTLTTRFGWPIEAFGEPTAITGFTMHRAPETFFFDLKISGRTRNEPLSAKHFMYEKYWSGLSIQTKEPEASVEQRIDILLDLASALVVLHDNGLTYGDLSSNNVAINASGRPHVFLFDADSILTASERAKLPIVTPDWDTPKDLDPIQIDRSRFALFALRLFVREPAIRPMNGIAHKLPDRVESILPLIIDLYKQGDAASFDYLCDALRNRRPSEAATAAFHAALASGFARRVLQERAHAIVADDYAMIRFAEDQLYYEVAYISMSGKQRRQAARRTHLNRSHFRLDVPPIASLQNPPSTEEELKRLVHLAMFEEIAGHLVSEGLGALEDHGWLERAVQHALVETSGPELLVKTQRGSLSSQTWWPASQFVNYMQLHITHPSGTHEVEMRRGDASEQVERELRIDHGGAVELDLYFGTISPNGNIVWHPEPLTEFYDVEPAFDPPKVPSPVFQALPELSSELLDPRAVREQQIVERIEHEELQKSRRRRVLRNTTGAIAAAAILVLGVVLVSRSFSSDSPSSNTLRALIADAVNSAATTTIGDTPEAEPELRSQIDVTVEFQIESNLMITTLLRSDTDEAEYQIAWGETAPIRTIKRTSVFNPASPGNYSPLLTHIENDTATALDVGGSITIPDSQPAPSSIGLSDRMRVGFDDRGVLLRLGSNPSEFAEITVSTREVGAVAIMNYPMEWAPVIRVPIDSPGAWELRISTDDGTIPLPTVTLDSSHQLFSQTQTS